ncbi:Leucine-rich repeat transmembrane protein kinase family protein [Perilla frutescens var. hirtella]|uniref:Leucine-rich repeat transmembrane protein kinase family protein n=1 Tax=Perilla frutescens var. hirtella TaxID=608512 RepID=A0AAD4P244_PERFH|nr:Leucine-rich repeat transmembrane protein kinase family protein [Perilla frutescens var. hirtella]
MPSKAVALFQLFLIKCLLFPTISGLNQEGLSLLAWLSTFNSSSSAGFFSSWQPTHQTPCKWDYIKCTDHAFVSEITITSIYLPTTFPDHVLSFEFLRVLVLSNGNLTGEIPSSLGNRSSLINLDLSFNSLTGKIPHEIGKLSVLQQLSLSSNYLEGQIPEEIGNCTQLQHLELFDNQLVGKIPTEIGQLTSLEIFRAGGNLIDGEIPAQLSNCTMLSFLGLADTGITGPIPHSLGALRNLKTLSIYTSHLTGDIPPELGNCSSLESLFIYQNQVSGEIPTEIGSLKNLKKLLLWQNNLTGAIPVALGNCSSLTVIDLSINLLSGGIPPSLQNLGMLEGLLLSDNHIIGVIPEYIGNFSNLSQLELDNNNISGGIPSTIGMLKELTLFFAWQNHLHGDIPKELANCQKLQDLDLSNNYLTGPVPKHLFNLNNLTKLLLISNQLSGKIPADIGNCSSLIRLRLGANMFHGEIPTEIGMLENLRFLELSENQFSGKIPPDVGNCKQLEMVDLHGNKLQGEIPLSLVSLLELNVLDLSMNEISGNIPESIGNLKSLNKLVLSGNNISGSIPRSLGLCKDLQLLDLSRNNLSSSIPDEIGHLQELDILLNMSMNSLTGDIPESFSSFSKLSNMDISHNMLVGSLQLLSNLDNLVSLNVSYNNFSGPVPNTKFFQNLPYDSFAGNEKLCFVKNKCYPSKDSHRRKYVRNLTILSVFIFIIVLIMVTAGAMHYTRTRGIEIKENDEEKGLQWEFTPFQKLNFSVEDVVTKLTDPNIVGRGSSGIVYRVEIPMRRVIAVKRLWPKKRDEIPQRDLFSAEVSTLGSIRHKNIVRLLGCCDNGKTRLLLFDYYSNGSLAGLLHEKRTCLDWNARYNIIIGAAQGLAYLHHDCIPPIVHRDIKTNNILVGPTFEAFLADFGLAKLVSSSDSSRASDVVAGSYGYIAPEYGYSLKITEKSDVYSYGIVLLEVLTGMEPSDTRIPDGKHIVTWVYEELQTKCRDFTSIVDPQLLLQSSTQTEEMLQVLGIALLCVNPGPDERPTMRDVIAMLEGIKHENEEPEKPNSIRQENASNPRAADHCSSFSRSSKPLILSPLHSL